MVKLPVFIKRSIIAFITFSVVIASTYLIPFLDTWLSDNTKGWLLFLLPLVAGSYFVAFTLLFTVGLTKNLSLVFAVWLIVRLLEPIPFHLAGVICNDQFFRGMHTPEHLLLAFFARVFITYAIATVRSYSYIVFMGTAIICGLAYVLPQKNVAIIKFLVNPDRFLISANILSLTLRFRFSFGEREIQAAKQDAEDNVPEETYQYRHLKPGHIRLLKLDQKVWGSAPSCTLVHVPLDTEIPFEALSYRWGSQSIHLEVEKRKLLVSSSVQDFLLEQRSLLGYQHFWIDAICINQENNAEKSTQVQLMKDIYKKAARVIVWLGRPESLIKTRNLQILIRGLRWPHPSGDASAILIPVEDVQLALQALKELFSNEWFERMWIIQEVAVGNRIHVMTNGLSI